MKQRLRSLYAIIFTVFCIVFFSFRESEELNLFISPKGSDLNSGSINSPLRTLIKAQALIRVALSSKKYVKINVNLRGGTYFINKPLLFTTKDGGTATCMVEYKSYKREKPVIAGGMTLPKQWVKADKVKNYWKVKLTLPFDGNLNQLFANGKRLHRASSPTFYTVGPIKQYAQQIQGLKHNFKTVADLRRKDLLPFCSFAYNGSDLDNLDTDDINNAELLLFHSWNCSWHNIEKVDKTYSSVYLKSPANLPVGFFENRTRYTIENCKKYLKMPEDWYYDKAKKELWYVAKENQNPNALFFIVPKINQLILLRGDPKNDISVQNISFTGLYFQYTNAPRGINVDAKLMSAGVGTNVPWLDSKTGFSTYVFDVESGQAVTLQSARNVIFKNCSFSKLGSYALRIDQYSDNNKVFNSEFYDLGGGGVIIGFNHSNPSSVGIPVESSPSNNIISNCHIHGIGIIYPSSVGIAIMNAKKSLISNNVIYNTPYSGISCGLTLGFSKNNYTTDNVIENNRIHDVLRLLADGGGIYTLGVQPHTVIKGNTIYNIYRSKDAIGSYNNGIFFDEGSSDMYVDKNVIYQIQNKGVRFNKTDSTNIIWGNNNIK